MTVKLSKIQALLKLINEEVITMEDIKDTEYKTEVEKVLISQQIQ